MKILDVGCGTCKFDGAIGIDRLKLKGVDIVIDLEQFPWPFEENTFDRIIFKHSLSHFPDIIAVMEEVHRISSPNAIVDILAPHYTCDNFLTDPTHKISLGYRSMYYFCTNIPNWKYKYSKASFKLLKSYICFGEYKIDFNMNEFLKRMSILKLIGVEYIVNKVPRIYEKFFCFIMPASEVYFQMKVEK